MPTPTSRTRGDSTSAVTPRSAPGWRASPPSRATSASTPESLSGNRPGGLWKESARRRVEFLAAEEALDRRRERPRDLRLDDAVVRAQIADRRPCRVAA